MSGMHEVHAQRETVSIFDLISRLKASHDVPPADDVDLSATWKVSFRGEPSFRHVNRIAMFREYLDALLPGDLEAVGAERGSVVVLFGQHEVSDVFVHESKELIRHSDKFESIAAFLGISELRFDGCALKFDQQA
jgi:hypothetical protein